MRSPGDAVYENYARFLRASSRCFGRARSWSRAFTMSCKPACAHVCQLCASAGESELVRVRTRCAKTAYLCGLSYPSRRVWTLFFSLVMSRSAVRVRSSALYIWLK
jgi:hypothetical protein